MLQVRREAEHRVLPSVGVCGRTHRCGLREESGFSVLSRVPFPRSSGSWRGLHFSPDKVTEQETNSQRGGRRCGAPSESEVRLLSGPAVAVEPARLERRWMASSANVRLVFVLKLTERLHLEQMCLSSDLVVGNVYRSRQERASTTARLGPLFPCLTVVQH